MDSPGRVGRGRHALARRRNPAIILEARVTLGGAARPSNDDSGLHTGGEDPMRLVVRRALPLDTLHRAVRNASGSMQVRRTQRRHHELASRREGAPGQGIQGSGLQRLSTRTEVSRTLETPKYKLERESHGCEGRDVVSRGRA